MSPLPLKDHMSGYLAWVTPTPGDSTYSLLKAHLLFESMLRAYLDRVLPHPDALQGSRLTFAQVLAVARASSPHVEPDCWIWKAIGNLNRIRNLFAHEAQPAGLTEKIDAYVKLVQQMTFKLPEPGPYRIEDEGHQTYTELDMVTFALYYVVADRLKFKVNLDDASSSQAAAG